MPDTLYTYSTEKLEKILSKKVDHKRKYKAAVMIQKYARRFLLRNKYLKLIEKRNKAAAYLQNAWKSYRIVSIMPKFLKKSKFIKLTLIQKYLRGYLTYHKYQKAILNKRLSENGKFFDEIKLNLQNESQRKIRHFWKVSKRRNERMAQEVYFN